jgi:hypothetical protein
LPSANECFKNIAEVSNYEALFGILFDQAPTLSTMMDVPVAYCPINRAYFIITCMAIILACVIAYDKFSLLYVLSISALTMLLS